MPRCPFPPPTLVVAAALVLAGAPAGAASPPAAGDAPRSAAAEPLASPTGAAATADGAWLVTEWSAGRVTRIDAQGRRRTVARVASPSGIVVGPDGALLVASYGDGVVYRVAPGAAPDATPQPVVRGLRTPAGLSLEPDGRLLIADRGLGQVLRREADGTLSVLARDLPTPVQAVRLVSGALVVANLSGTVVEIGGDGVPRVLTDRLGAPAVGMLADGPDAVLVPDYRGREVWRVSRRGDAAPVLNGLATPVAMARSHDGTRLAVGTWGDGGWREFTLEGTR